ANERVRKLPAGSRQWPTGIGALPTTSDRVVESQASPVGRALSIEGRIFGLGDALAPRREGVRVALMPARRRLRFRSPEASANLLVPELDQQVALLHSVVLLHGNLVDAAADARAELD